MSGTETITDGSSESDSSIVEIDTNDKIDRMRYRCPNNHTRWVPTNNHVYCNSCSQISGAGPEYYELLDAKTGESIPWERVVLR